MRREVRYNPRQEKRSDHCAPKITLHPIGDIHVNDWDTNRWRSKGASDMTFPGYSGVEAVEMEMPGASLFLLVAHVVEFDDDLVEECRTCINASL